MKYAYVRDGVAIEVVETDPAMLFVPHYAAQFVQVPDEVQAGWTQDVFGDWSSPQANVATIKAQHWDAIKQERDRRTQAGGYQVAGKWFHSDTFSRTQQMGLVMMGADIPAGLQWKTMDGSFVTMSQTLASQVFAAAAASDAALFARAEQIKAAMEADPANFVLSSQSWPSVYGEAQ